MGQPITVLRKPTSNPGVVRYEVNRNLTGMGHERYRADQPVLGERPPDELARRLFARGGIDAVHVYLNMVTVDLDEFRDETGIEDIVRDLYLYYREGDTTPTG